MRAQILQLLLEEIENYSEQLDEPIHTEKGEESVLFGRGSTLDSVDLVSLIVTVEQAVEDRFDKTITIADARAMSQIHSPFRTIGSFADYILLLLEEA